MEEQRWLRRAERTWKEPGTVAKLGIMNKLASNPSKLLKKTDSLVGNEIPSQYYSEEDASQCTSYAPSIWKTAKEFMSA